MERSRCLKMEIITEEQLQKYSTCFYDTSILTRVNIPRPMYDTQIIVLSKIFTVTNGYKLCTICLIPFTNDIVIEAYKIYEENYVTYDGGIELCNFGEVNLRSGYSYIIYLDETKYIPFLILDSSQLPTIELVEHNTLPTSSMSNSYNKTVFIKQLLQIWFFIFVVYCIYMYYQK